jgi:hypothetical protein
VKNRSDRRRRIRRQLLQGDPGPIAGLLDQSIRQMPTGEVGKRRGREDLLDPVLRLRQQTAQRASADVFAIGVGLQTALQGDGTFDRLDDLQGGDLGRWAGQAESATGSPGGPDDAGFGQTLEDLAKKALGNRLLIAEDVDHHHLAHRTTRQGDEPQNSVFSCFGDLHVLNRTVFVRK